jgi:hypothetical protein
MIAAMNASAQWVQMSNWNGSGKLITSIASDSNYLFVGTNIDGLYRSTNNGESFIKTSLNVYLVYSIVVSGNNVFAGTETGLCRSTDKGNSWSLNSFNYITIPKIFIQGNYVYVSTDSMNTYKVYFSSNNGTNWRKTNLNSQKITSFTYDGNYIYAASIVFGGNDNRPPIFRSVLGDTSFNLISAVDSLGIGERQSVGALASLGNYVFAGMQNFQGYTRSVYRSSNNGLSWIPTILDEGDTYALTTIANNLIAATTSGIFISTNSGTNWIIKNQGFGYTYYSINNLCKNNNYIFATERGQLQLIWRRPLSEIIGIQNISTETPAKYSLGQNYPNPFNPMCNVQFSMYKAGNVRLVVYDVQGREVQTLVNEKLSAGTYEVKFDGSMLNSGVYFYKLSTDGFTETKKMLLIK